ncbi:MAG: hypothetical protein AAB510_02985 [Patescibacteria group bacterium]
MSFEGFKRKAQEIIGFKKSNEDYLSEIHGLINMYRNMNTRLQNVTPITAEQSDKYKKIFNFININRNDVLEKQQNLERMEIIGGDILQEFFIQLHKNKLKNIESEINTLSSLIYAHQFNAKR